jgi:oligo-1,6-glucosidase/alpha-glucosidase
MIQQHWWKNTTIYQVYPRSFNDTNGDGIGDLPGIVTKLDYLKDLGIETIWISPFFVSPQADWGYDISGYREIAPEYGTMTDVEHLIDEIHERDMKVIFDLVLNHTSDQHPWFIESSSSRNNPKSDWYIWQDGKSPGKPPNNWKALPGGSGWHYHPDRDQWYYASFLPFQPDLNWRNPAVKQEMFRVAEFWLDKGVDGFRLDIFHSIFKAGPFQDNPWHWSYIPREDKFGFFTEWKYTVNLPETIQLAQEFRQLIDEYSPQRFLIGEIFGQDKVVKQYLGDGTSGMQMVFLWDLMDFKFKAEFFWDVIHKYEEVYPPPYTPVLVLGNHDSQRWIDKIEGNFQKAKLITLLQFTARGVPVIYYGEEIGLPEGNFPARDALDPVGQRYAWAPNWLLSLLNLYINRDNCRTPMLWDGTPGAGFTVPETDPWLPISAEPRTLNVEIQNDNPDSLLNWYRDLLHLRKTSSELKTGDLNLFSRQLAMKGILGYYRQIDSSRLAVLINLDTGSTNVELKDANLLIGTGEIKLSNTSVKLGGLSGGVFKISQFTHQETGSSTAD